MGAFFGRSGFAAAEGFFLDAVDVATAAALSAAAGFLVVVFFAAVVFFVDRSAVIVFFKVFFALGGATAFPVPAVVFVLLGVFFEVFLVAVCFVADFLVAVFLPVADFLVADFFGLAADATAPDFFFCGLRFFTEDPVAVFEVRFFALRATALPEPDFAPAFPALADFEGAFFLAVLAVFTGFFELLRELFAEPLREAAFETFFLPEERDAFFLEGAIDSSVRAAEGPVGSWFEP